MYVITDVLRSLEDCIPTTDVYGGDDRFRACDGGY